MSRFLLLATVALVLTLGPAAHAAPGDDVRVVVHPDYKPVAATTVEKDDVYHSGKDWFVFPESKGDQLIDDPIPTGRQVVFLNFDGAALTSGGNDAKTDKTMLLTVSSHNYPAMTWTSYGGKEKGMKDIIKEVKILFYKYGVDFVTTRPTSGNYSMVMIGGSGQNCKGGGAAIGISPLDCKNSNKNDVLFVFGERITGAKKVAFVIAHELGHAVGLEHHDAPSGIMYPSLSGQTETWKTGNVSGSTCGRSTQDADKVLTENLGVGEPDKVAPLIWIMRPGDDAVLPGRFTLEVGAVDDFNLSSVIIYVDGTKKLTLTSPPFITLVEGLSDGKHKIKAEARDMKPNVASAEIEVKVDSSCVKGAECDPAGSKAGLGMPCAIGGDCATEVCATKAGDGYCAALCNKESKLCPSGYTCQDAGGEYACVKGGGFSLNKDSAGCAISGGGASGALLLSLFGLALLGLRRRRS